jgi:hypothetical protein
MSINASLHSSGRYAEIFLSFGLFTDKGKVSQRDLISISKNIQIGIYRIRKSLTGLLLNLRDEQARFSEIQIGRFANSHNKVFSLKLAKEFIATNPKQSRIENSKSSLLLRRNRYFNETDTNVLSAVVERRTALNCTLTTLGQRNLVAKQLSKTDRHFVRNITL